MSFSDQFTSNNDNDDGYLSDVSDVSDVSDYTTDHDDEPSFPKDPYEQFDIEFISHKTKSRAPITTRGYQRGRRNGAHYYRRNCRKSQRVNTKAISVARGDKYELSEGEPEEESEPEEDEEESEPEEESETKYWSSHLDDDDYEESEGNRVRTALFKYTLLGAITTAEYSLFLDHYYKIVENAKTGNTQNTYYLFLGFLHKYYEIKNKCK